jgi:hypothetical protein
MHARLEAQSPAIMPCPPLASSHTILPSRFISNLRSPILSHWTVSAKGSSNLSIKH